MRRY
ncbi:Protein PsiE, partial [Haemophilus influenzae]|jgi:hypothetical protein